MPARAQTPAFLIDWGEGTVDPAVQLRIERQITMVRGVRVRPDVLAFWAAETIHIQPRPGMPSRAMDRVLITRDIFPDDNPVLLHELIHRWHRDRLANTSRVRPLREAFAAERAAPQWPASAYMYTNITEYLAMCGSVAIHGRAARPPLTRENVQSRLPDTWAFIVAEFGLQV